MNNLKQVLIAGLLMIPFASQAAMEITAMGGLNMPSPSWKAEVLGTSLDIPATETGGIAGGVYAAFPFSANLFAFETGLTYLTSKYTLALSTSKVETTRLQIPLLLRVIKLPIVSFGVGAYYEMGLGKVKLTDTTTGASTNQSYKDTGIKSGDYGILADLRFRIPVGPKFGIVLDGRYNYGLAEMSETAPALKVKNSAIQAMGGISIMI